MNRKTATFWAILLFAIAVRAYGLVSLPFEQDEMYTIDEATNLFHTTLPPGIQARPLFFLMEHPIVTSLPHTPLVLRSIPFLFGILGVLVTWLAARRLVGETGGMAAALLVAISPWHIYASGFARYYSILYVMAALVYWWLPTAYDDDRPKSYLITLFALFIGTWMHPTFIFPVACATLAVTMSLGNGTLGWRWPSANAWRYLWAPFIVASGAIVVAIKMTHHTPGVVNPGELGLAASIRLLPAMVDWMTPAVFITATIGAFLLLWSENVRWRRVGRMALFGMIGMLAVLFVLSFKMQVYADYGMAALPLVFIAAGGLFQWVHDAIAVQHRRVIVGIVGALVVIGVLPSMLSHLSDGTRFDYRPAFATIAAKGPNEAVLAWPIILQRAYAPKLRTYELHPGTARLDSLLTKEQSMWAVVSNKRYGIVGDDGSIATWLNGKCRLTGAYQRPRLDYRMYRVELWHCQSAAN